MKKNYLLYSFCGTVLLMSILDIVEPVKDFSEFENRKLKKEVKITGKSFLNGEFSKGYEEYVNDQFIYRDKFITFKSVIEKNLGKVENNEVLLGRNGYLFYKYFNLDRHRIDYNVQCLKKFASKRDENVSFMLVPNSYEVYKEYLKRNPPIVDQKVEIEKAYKELEGINNINLVEIFNQKKSENLYYKTDHHWSLEGAYLAYKTYIESIGKKAVDILKDKKVVEKFYGTFYSRAKDIGVDGDNLGYVPIEDLELEIGENKYDSIYNLEKLETRDKYEMFLYGNNPYIKITNRNLKSKEKILVIKDSYANSFVPFLTQNFKEVYVIDLRSFGESLKGVLEGENFNEILVLYNFYSFSTDASFLKVNT